MNRYDGFHEFVVARGGALSRTAYLLTGEHHAAEDLVQSALAKAATRWRQILEYGQPEAYIRRIMINEQISWWRRRPARPVAQVPDRAGPDEPHQVVDRIALGEALDTLTPRQRAVVVLRFYEDLSEADTAAAMGCSVGTVKSQTHLALGHLRRALPLFAADAGQYADAGAAVAAARRRRTRRTALVAALAVLPLALGIAVYALRGGDTVPPPPLTGTPSPSPSAAASATVPGLPSALPAPGTPLDDLPTDRGVGIASLMRTDWRADPYRVDVLAAGRWHRMRLPKTKQSTFASLSPDGRWLCWTTPDAVVVRDLTGTAEHRVPGSQVVGWSPSSTWLVVRGPAPHGDRVVPVADWAPLEVPPAAPGRHLKGVLDTGEVLYAAEQRTAGTVLLEMVDPRTRAVRAVEADLNPLLQPGEGIAPVAIRPVIFMASSGNVVVEAWAREPKTLSMRDSFVEVSLRDGSLLGRYALPAGTKGRPLCLRGEDLLWNGGSAVRLIRPGGQGTPAALSLVPGWTYHMPACWRVADVS